MRFAGKAQRNDGDAGWFFRVQYQFLNPSFHFRNRAVRLVCKLAFMSIPMKDSTNFLSRKQYTGKVPRFKSFVLIAGHLNLQPTLLFKEGEIGLFVFLDIRYHPVKCLVSQQSDWQPTLW